MRVHIPFHESSPLFAVLKTQRTTNTVEVVSLTVIYPFQLHNMMLNERFPKKLSKCSINSIISQPKITAQNQNAVVYGVSHFTVMIHTKLWQINPFVKHVCCEGLLFLQPEGLSFTGTWAGLTLLLINVQTDWSLCTGSATRQPLSLIHTQKHMHADTHTSAAVKHSETGPTTSPPATLFVTVSLKSIHLLWQQAYTVHYDGWCWKCW